MTEKGAMNLVERLMGTYPHDYIMSDDKLKLVLDNMVRNFRDYTDDEVDDALTVYINTDSKNEPPGSGQLKTIINGKVSSHPAENDWDKSRLVEDAEGRIWYNESYTLVRSSDGSRMVSKPNHDRPFDGRKGYRSVRIPKSDEELIAICKKHGYHYEEHEPVQKVGENGIARVKRYTFGDEIENWVENDRFRGQLR